MGSETTSWQEVSPCDWASEQRLAASKHSQERVLEILGCEIPGDRQTAISVIGAAYSSTPLQERSDKFLLSKDVVSHPWEQLSGQQIDHVLMTIVHSSSGDFRTAYRIVFGEDYDEGFLHADPE